MVVVVTKIMSTLFRALQILGTMYAAGITTYLIIKIAKDSSSKPDGKAIAIEVISGAAFLYVCGVFLLGICLLQKTFFQFGTLFWDILFCGGFVAVAVLLRHAAGQKCGGMNTSPSPTFLENATSHASINCKLVKGLFGAAVGLAVLFFITALLALLAHARSKKERSQGQTTDYNTRHSRRNKEAAAITPVAAAHHHNNRHSVDTAVTEKASDDMMLDNTHDNNSTGREYGNGRGNTGTTLMTPASVPAPHNVSPMPSNYSSNMNYNNTRHGREPTSSAGLAEEYPAQSRYAANDNSAELGSANYDNGRIDNRVGGVTGGVYDSLSPGRREMAGGRGRSANVGDYQA